MEWFPSNFPSNTPNFRHIKLAKFNRDPHNYGISICKSLILWSDQKYCQLRTKVVNLILLKFWYSQ